MKRFNMFTRIIILMLIIWVPLVALYVHANRVSLGIVNKDIRSTNLERLGFLVEQMEREADSINILSGLLSRDPIIQTVEYYHLPASTHEDFAYITTIMDKLRLHSIANGWESEFRLFVPGAEFALSKNGLVSYNSDYVATMTSEGWSYRPYPDLQSGIYRFVKYNAEPFGLDIPPAEANRIIEASFTPESIRRMLEQFNSSERNETFLYHPDHGVIRNLTGEHSYVQPLIQLMADDPSMLEAKNQKVRVDGRSLMVNAMKIERLNWYVVDYVPLEDIVGPMERNNQVFYASIAAIALIGLLIAVVLYKQIQSPIRELLRNVKQMKKGNYSLRVRSTYHNEFDVLSLHYNEMADQIQTLIERVYQEEIRSREATLKQLQAQINPHFLYNCMYFIMNMSTLGEDEAVREMALNLGHYYRYTTRTENQLPTMEEELRLVEHYLTIQRLRMNRIQFEVDVSPAMRVLPMPRLLLQPIVENAVIHGLEPCPGPGHIRIAGSILNDTCQLIIEDNGIGLSDDALSELRKKLELPLIDSDSGCGLWNVRQRLKYQFGTDAEFRIEGRDRGIRFIMRWKCPQSDIHREEREH
jgi:two-component system sensor histidine kinase YesM